MFPPLKKLSFGFALSMEMGSCQGKNITHSPHRLSPHTKRTLPKNLSTTRALPQQHSY